LEMCSAGKEFAPATTTRGGTPVKRSAAKRKAVVAAARKSRNRLCLAMVIGECLALVTDSSFGRLASNCWEGRSDPIV
jgi:hypothetical protein